MRNKILFLLVFFSFLYSEEEYPPQVEYSHKIILEQATYLIDDEYIVGPGDYFIIYITGNMNKNFNVIVSSNGTIFIPLIGEIKVTGMNIKSLKEKIKNSLSEYYKDIKVSIQWIGRTKIRAYSRYSSIFSIRGEVLYPGIYELRENDTIMNVIYAAGGFTQDADLRKVYIQRNENGKNKIIPIDVLRIIVEKNNNENVYIKNGDIVVIPSIPKFVNVAGEVRKPGAYSYFPGASIYYYIGLAGGITEKADEKEAYIVKMNGEIIKQKNYLIEQGDTIVIPCKFSIFDYLLPAINIVTGIATILVIFKVIK
jgi:protein involved in polysaccharide export with SLBB domain